MEKTTVKKKAAKKKSAVKQKTLPAVQADKHDVVAQAQMSPIQQMQQLKEMGMSVDDMKGMLELQKEYEANEAMKQFNVALAAFKAEDFVVTKDRRVRYQNKDESWTEYSHASLANYIATATPYLSKHGFSVRWNTEQGTEASKGGVRVTCIMTHRAGHSESTSLFSSPDNSGGKNSIQAISSAVTYLERYTFAAILGLSAEEANTDDDGRGTSDQNKSELLPEYPQESFDKNKSQWVDFITSGEKQVESIINTVESRYTMTEDQKTDLRSYTKQEIN